MIDAIIEALGFAFMRNALAAGVLFSVACGVIGTFVVVNRIVFISGGIARAAYGDIGLGYYFRYSVLPTLLAQRALAQLDPSPGCYPILGAILFSPLSTLGMDVVQRKTRGRADTVIGVMWAIGIISAPHSVDKMHIPVKLWWMKNETLSSRLCCWSNHR